jgi:hypothetical protein
MTRGVYAGVKYGYRRGADIGNGNDEASNGDVSDVDICSGKIGDVDVQRQQSQ